MNLKCFRSRKSNAEQCMTGGSFQLSMDTHQRQQQYVSCQDDKDIEAYN